MEILEYDEVDPLKVIYVTKLALDFVLTPERVAHMRQEDLRPFPCFALYAVEAGDVLGQVGVFRLPMISTEGREDVGGVWAVSTHPAYAGRGVASCLLDAAHERMRAAGLRFSTLGTSRFRVAYRLYQQHGYMETNVLTSALARWDTVHQPTRLRARPAGPQGYDRLEEIFTEIAPSYLGFSWRYTPFDRLRVVSLEDYWILLANDRPVGYAITRCDPTLLDISNLLLRMDIDAAEAVAAIAAEIPSTYVRVKISRPVEIASLRSAGFHVASPTWDAFMVKPLVPEVTYADAERLYGIGTDRFLISWLDVT